MTKKSDTTTKLQELDYTFDNNGNVTEIDDTVNSMTQDFTYDDLNRLTQAIGSAYGTQNFTYDSIGNMTNKDGQIMAYGAGSAGPHAVTSITGMVRPTYCPKLVADCTFTYDSNGNMTDRGVDDLTYDSENRLTEIDVYEGSTGTHNFSLAQGWNAISFTYLPENRSVTSVFSDMTWSTDYSQVSYWNESTNEWEHFVNDADFNDFDQFEHGKTYKVYIETAGGETPSVTGTSPAVDVTHNIVSGDNYISPAVTSTTAVATVLSGVTYTAVYEFNTTSDTWVTATNFEVGKGYKITASGSDSFDYGGASATTTTFVYDSTGARVKKAVGSTTTVYLGKDYDKTGSDVTKYIFLGDRRIATRKNSDGAEYIHGDHINSSNVITDASENRVGYHEYDPYGSTVVANPEVGDTVDPKHKFTGQEEDSSAKLMYYGARYYDPQLGRFITADPTIQHPTDPQDFNRYAYARNNPIKFTDPTGFGFFSKLLGVIGAVIGYAVGNFLCGPGCGILGATVGGAIGGAVGGVIDASITGGSIQNQAIFGAVEGAIIGYQVGRSMAGSPESQIEIRIRKEAESYVEQQLEEAILGSGLSTEVETIEISASFSGVRVPGHQAQSTTRNVVAMEYNTDIGGYFADRLFARGEAANKAAGFGSSQSAAGAPPMVGPNGEMVLAPTVQTMDVNQASIQTAGTVGLYRGAAERITRALARFVAHKLGFKRFRGKVPFDPKGQEVFKKGNIFISADATRHKGGFWKAFDSKGNRLGTFDQSLQNKVGP